MAENYRTPKRPHHQRAKSAIVRSILSSKTNAAHHELPSPSKKSNRGAPLDFTIYDQAGELTALGSPIDQNISLPWQSAENQQPSLETRRGRSRSITSMFARARSKSRVAETRLETGTSENSTGKPAPIVKPRNNFSGFLKRPKSFIGEASSNLAEKENTPPTPVDEHTPIWAQFATSSGMDAGVAPEGIYRPVSSHYSHKRSESKPDAPRPSNWSSSSSTSIPRSLHDSDHQRYQRLDPIVLEEQFEELLSQRNIPDAVKEQMRKLQPALKADFVRKAGVRGDSRPGSAEMAHPTMVAQRSGRPEPTPRPPESSKPKKAPRPKSWTLGFTRSAESKAQAIRGSDKGSSGDSNPMPLKSTMDKGTSDLQSIEKLGVGIIGKSRKVLPGEFVSYLSQKGSLASIEVGRLHKLRVLLRNESVEWVDEFMHLEGMDKLIKLLYRVTKVEWRYVITDP